MRPLRRDDLRRRRRTGKASDVRRMAQADQVQLQRRRDDELSADTHRPLRLLRRQDRSSTDMNTAAPGQFFDDIQRARHAESNLDELDTAIGSGVSESEGILWALSSARRRLSGSRVIRKLI